MVIQILHLEDKAQEPKLLLVRYLPVLKCMVQAGLKAKARMQLTVTHNSLHSQWGSVQPVFHLIKKTHYELYLHLVLQCLEA